MKQSGKCPKCESMDIVTNEGMAKGGMDRISFSVKGFKNLHFSMYLCRNCGFVEEYISKEDLADEKMMANLESRMRKLN